MRTWSSCLSRGPKQFMAELYWPGAEFREQADRVLISF